MAGSRDVVKFTELLAMSAVGGHALLEYIKLRIEDVDAKGPEKLIKLLGHIQKQLDEKPNRKDSTSWLLGEDETSLKKLLGGTRKRLAMPEKPQDQTLTLERMKAEILGAMMEYVLAKNQKKKSTQLSPLYVDAVNQYGTDADRALLSDAGLGRGVTYAAAAVSSFFGMGEKEAEKLKRVNGRRKDLQNALAQTRSKAEALGHAIADLHASSGAFAELFTDVEKIIDDLTRFASDADKMDVMNNASLIQIAASLEQTASFINKLIHEVGVFNDPALGQRLQLYKQLQVVADQLFEKQHKLAGLMLERLKYLDADVLRELDPHNVDFNNSYECDKRMEEWKQKLSPKTVELFRQQANKMADEDESKKGKKIDTIDVAAIIKFQAYIAKSGTTEQKKELLGMQAATLSASPEENWLKTKLKYWNMSCPNEIKHFILGIQDKHHYFDSQADLEVLQNVLQIILGYKNRLTMLGVLQHIDEKNLIVDGDGFRSLSQLMGHFSYDGSFGASGDKVLDRLIKMCDESDELASLMSGINAMDEKQKSFFMRFLMMQDAANDPPEPLIKQLPDVYQLFSLIEEGKTNPVFMQLCDALLEKFKNDDQKDLLKLLGDCAKLSEGKYSGDMMVAPQLILDLLPQVESMEQIFAQIDAVLTHLEDAPLLTYLYQHAGLSVNDVNAMIKHVYNVKIANDDDVMNVIQQQKSVIGDLCLREGFGVFADLARNKLIDFNQQGAAKDAAGSVMALVNNINLTMNFIAAGNKDHAELLKIMNEMLDEIVAFKINFKDADGISHRMADAIINDLIDKLAPKFTENSDLKMVLYVNLVKAVARTPSIAVMEGRDLISSTLDLSSKYKGDHDGEQKLLKLATTSLRLIHSPEGKGEELKQTLKSLQEFGASAAFKRNILRFAKAVVALVGKIIKPAAVKGEELEQRVRFFDAKSKSAAALHERVREVSDSPIVLPQSSDRKPER